MQHVYAGITLVAGGEERGHFLLPDAMPTDIVKVRCPWHQEETPSCVCNLAAMRFQCLGCHVYGGIRLYALVGEWLGDIPPHL